MNSKLQKNKLLNAFILMSLALMMSACVRIYHDTSREKVYKIPPPEDSVARGKILYTSYCTECHGEDAEGTGSRVKNLKKKPVNLKSYGTHLTQFGLTMIIDKPHYSVPTIKRRIKTGNDIMPALKDRLSTKEIDDVTNYVLSLIYK